MTNNQLEHRLEGMNIAEVKEERREAFDLLMYIVALNPYNVNAIQEASDNHIFWCQRYRLLLLADNMLPNRLNEALQGNIYADSQEKDKESKFMPIERGSWI